MSDKKVTPHQMRKGLTYVAQGPDFMRMLTGQSSNAANNDPRNPYKKPIGIEAKFQTEENDDDDDETAHDILNEREEERPTVVVLKDGKHLDERQVRNVLKNLPPGLSEAEIQKRLAEEMDKLGQDDDDDDEEKEEDDDDQEPVDANGKILFRRPKGSKIKAKKQLTTASSTNKQQSLEEIISEETVVKANALKRKAGEGSTSKGVNSADKKDKKDKKEGSSNNTGDNSSYNNNSSSAKKKKQKTTKPTASLLSFDDEE
ncbi:hypothetical protein BGX26_000148 [Mortierella sp. AD094]|nr:hypothetical protein BGX26_000148 [Mortierella sp. AD094]